MRPEVDPRGPLRGGGTERRRINSTGPGRLAAPSGPRREAQWRSWSRGSATRLGLRGRLRVREAENPEAWVCLPALLSASCGPGLSGRPRAHALAPVVSVKCSI